MKTIYLEPLTPEAFRPYGEYVCLLQTGEGNGFYPDLIQIPLGLTVTTAGLARVGAERTATMLEYHCFTSEGFMPLNGDCVFFVGSPVPGNPFAADLHAFRAPKGTMIRLNPGVVHGTQFAVDARSVDVLLLLPAFTFGNDTKLVMLHEEECIRIVDSEERT